VAAPPENGARFQRQAWGLSSAAAGHRIFNIKSGCLACMKAGDPAKHIVFKGSGIFGESLRSVSGGSGDSCEALHHDA